VNATPFPITIGATPLPTVSSLVPNSGYQGQTLTGVLINGSNLTGATALTFSGSGVTASGLSVNGAGTQITATVTIGAAAALGARNVTATTPAGTSAALLGGFTVTAPSPVAAPTNVTATVGPGNTVTLTWTDNSTNETGFSIQRATNSTFTAGMVQNFVGANVTTFNTGSLPPGTYYFRVLAYRSGVGASPWVNATPFPITEP